MQNMNSMMPMLPNMPMMNPLLNNPLLQNQNIRAVNPMMNPFMNPFLQNLMPPGGPQNVPKAPPVEKHQGQYPTVMIPGIGPCMMIPTNNMNQENRNSEDSRSSNNSSRRSTVDLTNAPDLSKRRHRYRDEKLYKCILRLYVG